MGNANNEQHRPRRFFSCTFLIIVIFGVHPVSAHEMLVKIGDFAEIELPPGAALKQSQGQMPDFSVYYVTRMDKKLLGIYFGNSPEMDQSRLQSEYKFGRCVGRVLDRPSANGRDLDAVLELQGGTFPRFIHFFSRGLSHQEVSDVYYS